VGLFADVIQKFTQKPFYILHPKGFSGYPEKPLGNIFSAKGRHFITRNPFPIHGELAFALAGKLFDKQSRRVRSTSQFQHVDHKTMSIQHSSMAHVV
jgi:hypothetical protein